MRKGENLKFLEAIKKWELESSELSSFSPWELFHHNPFHMILVADGVTSQLCPLSSHFCKEQADNATIWKDGTMSWYHRTVGAVSKVQKQLPV